MRLYNSLTRKTEEFKSLKPSEASFYICGPTVYDYAHIGNLRTMLMGDLIRRALEYNGYKVTQVMNITDVGHLTSDSDTGEDKMEKNASTVAEVLAIAQKYTDSFVANLKALNIEMPGKMPKASEHVPEQIEMIKTLIEKGSAYESSEAVYFDIGKTPDYTQLIGQKLEAMKLGARQDVVSDPSKKNPHDFVLWFKAVGRYAKHIQRWASPWGEGFPGWHIECSAMATKYLGKQFDLHCGGIDHIPVHHTNEIAQSEAANGKKPWVKYWLHNEFLVLSQGEKMSKSKEKFITLSTLIEKGLDPLDYRYFCLGTHYRKPLMFSSEALEGAKSSRKKLVLKVTELARTGKASPSKQKKYLQIFTKEINDDLNTAKALAVLWDVLKDEKLSDKDKHSLILKFDEIFGLELHKAKKEKITIPEEVEKLAQLRLLARINKDWKKADELREKIKELGYVVGDTKEGYEISKA